MTGVIEQRNASQLIGKLKERLTASSGDTKILIRLIDGALQTRQQTTVGQTRCMTQYVLHGWRSGRAARHHLPPLFTLPHFLASPRGDESMHRIR